MGSEYRRAFNVIVNLMEDFTEVVMHKFDTVGSWKFRCDCGNKAMIVFHEKVVEIPLEGSGILKVLGERTLGAAKVPRATPVAKSLYRLAPSEMQELSRQLQELQYKGFIRSSHSLWGAPGLFVKKKDGSFLMCIDYRE
ncbi:hypothetical protein Tco_0445850 [Tanacetum coccineum]